MSGQCPDTVDTAPKLLKRGLSGEGQISAKVAPTPYPPVGLSHTYYTTMSVRARECPSRLICFGSGGRLLRRRRGVGAVLLEDEAV